MTGYVMALNGGPISWRSCQQGGVTLSSAEAEYVAASASTQEVIYLWSLLTGLQFAPVGPTEVWEDNAACISMSENLVNQDSSCHMMSPPPFSGRAVTQYQPQSKNNHIYVKFYFLREHACAGRIKLMKCAGLVTWRMPSPRVTESATACLCRSQRLHVGHSYFLFGVLQQLFRGSHGGCRGWQVSHPSSPLAHQWTLHAHPAADLFIFILFPCVVFSFSYHSSPVFLFCVWSSLGLGQSDPGGE